MPKRVVIYIKDVERARRFSARRARLIGEKISVSANRRQSRVEPRFQLRKRVSHRRCTAAHFNQSKSRPSRESIIHNMIRTTPQNNRAAAPQLKNIHTKRQRNHRKFWPRARMESAKHSKLLATHKIETAKAILGTRSNQGNN
jgi:hypothetical protein